MSALVVLIAASLILAIGFLIAFIGATKKGQYEDIYTPSVRILFDDQVQRNSDSDPVISEKEENPAPGKRRKTKNTKSKWK